MRALSIAVVMVLGMAGAAPAMTPTETVQRQVDQAVQTLTRIPRGAADATELRRAGIRRAADELFDFTEMSRRALGRHWDDRTVAERAEFVRVYTELMARAYLGKIDQYAGEAISYVGERVDRGQASVQSRVVTAKKSEVPIEYRLHKVGDRWAAYDVFVDNVSLVSTYRSQFDRIIQTGSFADLMKRLRAKEKEARLADAAPR
jgi:phospholipid transport system substrate-binding protein